MKNLFLALALFASALSLTAQDKTLVTTNAPVALTTEAASGKQSGLWEITLGGSGITMKDNSSYGLDFSIDTNPIKKWPSVWIGMAQGIAWEPKFFGSTDIFSDYSWNLWKDTLYLNTGWSVGVMYGDGDLIGRTGPEATFQYYLSDSAFIYAGVNYDLVTKGDNAFRYSVGLGFSF